MFGIHGAGSIGCYIGGRLVHAGETVTFVGREALGEEIATYGLTLTAVDGERFVIPSVTWTSDPDALVDCEVVMVAVKGLAVAEAGQLLATRLRPDAVVLALQNGVSSAATLREALGDRRVYACSVAFNVVRQGQGGFLQGTGGPLSTHGDVPAVVVERLRKAGMPVEQHPDMRAVLWGKLLLNLNNAVNALADVPLLQQFRDRDLRRVMAAAIGEALAVLRAEGIRPVSFLPVPPWLLTHILRLPTWLFLRIARRMVAIDPGARSSMWEDLSRGRRTEVRLLNGEVVALGERHGVPTPVNALIVEMVTAIEDGQDGRARLPELVALAR